MGFAITYLFFMIPTYLWRMVFVSVVLDKGVQQTDISAMSVNVCLLINYIILILITYYRAKKINRSYLTTFPLLGGVFDCFLGFIPFIPTIMNILAIVLGAQEQQNRIDALSAQNKIDQLEKLQSLKEKGVLTQDEFDKQKKELLSLHEKISKDRDNETSKTSIFNIISSMLITFVVFVFIIAFASYNGNFQEDNLWIGILLSAIIYSLIALKMKTQKYDAWYCQHPAGVFFGIVLLWLIAFPIYTYAFLQIKGKNVLLKEKDK